MEYSRPASSERFRFDGMKTNAVPDSLPAHKYPYAQNIRGTNEDSVQSRPQLSLNVAAAGSVIVAMEPSGGITKQGSILTSFATAAQIDTGYDINQGASIIPYRPNATPNLWDYVFDDNKLTKVNVQPGPVITIQKTGIAEPQSAPDAVPATYLLTDFTAAAASWANTGTAGALADANRHNGSIIAIRPDPSVFSSVNRFSLQVGSLQEFSVMEMLIDATLSATSVQVILDVIPPFTGNSINKIGSIFYFAGNTGHCIIVPSLGGAFATGVGDKSLFNVEQIANLRRGAMLGLNGTETVVVWSVIIGPGNEICIETSTTINHAVGEALFGFPTLVMGGGAFWAPADTIQSKVITSQVTAGVGLITQTLATNPFTARLTQIQGGATRSGNVPQQTDLIHMSFNVDTLANLTEIKILFDVGDGSFTQNFYYKTIRPSDIQAAIANSSTQLAASQIATQRAIIDAAVADAVGNQQDTGSSLQTVAGSTQWTEITFLISELTKIGGDDTLALGNVNAVQLLVNASGTVNIQFGGLYVGGGGNIDVGDTASPIFYRVRPRSSLTGAYGNPSPVTRYGVSPRRQSVILALPSAAYDTQIDTWDIERQGGAILGDPATNDSGWRYVGSTPATNSAYTDIIDDLSITRSYTRNIVDYEPFPGIGPPIKAISASVTGVIMLAVYSTVSTDPAVATLQQLGSLLPGNLFNIGANIFTLKKRPTLFSLGAGTQTYQFEFVENAGTQSNPLVLLQEPLLAAQTTSKVFGPDANGILFAVEVGIGAALFGVTQNTSGLRPGVVQTTNANNPDSADEANTSEIISPNEPLINGVMLGNTPFVASSNNWWRGFEKVDQAGRIRYSWNRQQVGKGLAAPFGICSDGKYVYFVSKNGIDRHAAGASESLTDEDLYNLFPHEGVYGHDVTFPGQSSIIAPEYAFAWAFRLSVVNNFLFFVYLDANQIFRTLVCDLRRMAWCVDRTDDAAFPQMTIYVGTGAPSSNNLLSSVKNQQLFIGGTNGAVYVEASPVAGVGEKVICNITTRGDTFGDIRSRKIFGDIALDCLPASIINVTPVIFNVLFGTVTTIAKGSRPDIPFNITLNGGQKDRSIGINVLWTDQGVNTILYSWQPSYLTQPEDIVTRFTDWSNAGSQGNKFWQGFNIEIDTLNIAKNIKIRDADSQLFHDFTSPVGVNLIKGNGQQVISCSFVTPFLAHLCRLEPQDLNVFSIFKVDWVTQPAPSGALTWITQASNFGLDGYIHLGPELLACYASTQPVTLTITAFDGLSPSAIVMPSTGGVVQKVSFPISPAKGLLFTFSGVSSAPWFPYLDSWEILIKAWGSPGPYQRIKPIGGNFGDSARI